MSEASWKGRDQLNEQENRHTCTTLCTSFLHGLVLLAMILFRTQIISFPSIQLERETAMDHPPELIVVFARRAGMVVILTVNLARCCHTLDAATVRMLACLRS